MEKPPVKPPNVVAPPPLLYTVGLLAGWGLHKAFPLNLFTGLLARFAGVALILLGMALVYWSFNTMRSIGTSVNLYTAAQALATEGPYRFSRNPIYVGMTGAYIGATLLMDSIWPILMLPPVIVTMHWGVICREEKHLEEIFGGGYQDYKDKVRRWL